MHRGSLIAALLLSGLPAAGAAARDFDCTGNLGRIELPGNLNVAGRCRLNGTEVQGNVTLFAGGSLVARDARVRGNIEAQRADFVDFDKTVITGNVRLEELVGDSSKIQQTRIRGNATLTKNRSRLEIVNNDVDGSLRATRNTGGITISGNSIGGKLECTGNEPPPVGLGNRVERGDAKGQCRNLQQEQADGPDPEPPPPASQPTTPPPASPPPSTSQPPPASPPSSPPAPPPPSTTPPPTSSPPASPPAAPPPSTSSPPAAPPPTDSAPAPAPDPVDPALDDGGAGAFGWTVALLVPLLARRRLLRRSRS